MDTQVVLAAIRNSLSNGRCDENCQKALLEVKEYISRVPGTLSELGQLGIEYALFSELGQLGIEYALKDIADLNQARAAIEIDFIHNLPLDWSQGRRPWNERHFYTMELFGYIELVSSDTELSRLKSYLEIIGRIKSIV